MQSYGHHSPSLGKMETSRAQYGARGPRFNRSNLFGDIFVVISLSLCMMGFFIALISAAIGQASFDGFPRYSWFAIVLTLILNVTVALAVMANSVQNYNIAIVGYSSALLVSTTSLMNVLFFNEYHPAKIGTGVGFLLICLVSVFWVGYFGASPAATPRAFIDSFSLGKEGGAGAGAGSVGRQTMHTYGMGRPETSTSVQPPQMYTSAQLNGFENPGSVAGARASNAPPGYPQSPQPAKLPGGGPADSEVVPPTEYPYRAKAIYSYEANPDDANEISFAKHDILEVSDVSGRWWQARKETGETGIAPSNYLILL
jgi:SHO1 osmosensor